MTARYIKSPKFKIPANTYSQNQILFKTEFSGPGIPDGFQMAAIQFVTETSQLNNINLAFFSDRLVGSYNVKDTFGFDIKDIDAFLPVYRMSTYDDRVAFNYQTVNIPVWCPNNIMSVVGYAGASLTYNDSDFGIIRVGVMTVSPYSGG